MSTENREVAYLKDKPLSEDYAYVYGELEDGSIVKVSKEQLGIEQIKESVSELNSNFYDSGWIIQNGEYCQYRVKNGICTVKGISDGYLTLTKGQYTHIGTVWSDCCPSSQLYFPLATFIDDCAGIVRIDTDGKIYVQSNKDGVKYWAYGFTYFI